ncbi:hypothetical protein GGH93_006032 [Coemansia aciculifera]|nr:hypothetical protein GGH93_006032 [Coemansia aciculifera]
MAAATPAKNLSEWKAKLPLLAVCRTWTELALSFVFYQVFVELPELPDSTSSAHFLWTSNAELFITRGCVLKAQCLNIELAYIKVLELTLDSSAVRVLPDICGETLKVLKLDEVPHNFAWHHFRYDMFDHPIVFRQLTVLHLTFEYEDIAFAEGEIRDRAASGVHCCDQLSFPALKQLYIQNCTPDCDLLYADHPFPELNYVPTEFYLGP